MITQSHSTPIRGLETQSVSSKHRPTSSRKASLLRRTAEGALSIPTRHCCPEFHTVRQHTRSHCADGWRVRGVEHDLTNATLRDTSGHTLKTEAPTAGTAPSPQLLTLHRRCRFCDLPEDIQMSSVLIPPPLLQFQFLLKEKVKHSAWHRRWVVTQAVTGHLVPPY